MAGFCEHGYESSGSIKDWEFYELRDYRFLKMPLQHGVKEIFL